MTDDIGFKIFAVIDGLKDSMAQASASVQHFSEKATKGVEDVNKGMKALTEVAEAYIAVLAVEKVEAFFDKFAEQATVVERLHLAFGATTDQVQELEFAMKSTGGGDGLQALLTRLSTALEKAIDNAGPQRKAFEDLGISIEFLRDNANNVPAVLDEVAEKIKELGGAQQNAADLTALMGRSWANNAGLLNQGKEGIEALGTAAKETGGVMNELEINQFEGLHKSIATMDEAINGFGITVASAFAPAFQSIVNGISEMVSAMNGGEEHVSLFRIALLAIVVPLDGLVLAFASVKTALVEMWQIFTLAADGMYFSFKGLGLVIGDFLRGDFSHMKTDWDETMTQMDAATKAHVAAMKQEITDLGATVSSMGQGIKTLAGGGDGEQYGPNPQAKKNKTTEEVNAEKAALAEKIQLAQLEVATKEQLGKIELSNKKAELSAEVAQGKITRQEEIDGLKNLADEEFKIDQQALQDEARIDGLTVVQKQKLNDQLLILQAKHEKEMQALDAQSVKARMDGIHQYFDIVNSGLRTMINGMLSGTQTLHQAWANLWTNMLANFAGFLEQKASKWAENQVYEMLFGKETAEAEALSTIAAHAAEAGAAAFASICAIPIIGPALAPAAATAAYSETMAFSAVASAAGGFDIPAGVNPVTQLHQREMVLPEPLADRVRSMTGGDSGGDTHLHFHGVVDGRQWIMDNGAHIAASLRRQARNANPHISFKV